MNVLLNSLEYSSQKGWLCSKGYCTVAEQPFSTLSFYLISYGLLINLSMQKEEEH